jgi:hypothetical protein
MSQCVIHAISRRPRHFRSLIGRPGSSTFGLATIAGSMSVAGTVAVQCVCRRWVIFDRASRFCLPADVRSPLAAEVVRRRNMSQWAMCGRCSSSGILRLIRHFEKRGSGSSGLELSYLQSMLQATVCDGSKFDASAFCDYRLRSVEVDVRRCDVVDALMIAGVIVVLDEGSDLSFEISG